MLLLNADTFGSLGSETGRNQMIFSGKGVK